MLIGNKIFDLRKKMKLSQEELAEKLNVSRQTVSNWETNQTVPDLYQAKELSGILNVDINELVGNETKEEQELFEDASHIWNNIKPKLAKKITKISYVTWFEPIIEAKMTKTKFVIYVEEKVAIIHINNHYKLILLKLIQENYSNEIKEIKIELRNY